MYQVIKCETNSFGDQIVVIKTPDGTCRECVNPEGEHEPVNKIILRLMRG